MEGTTPVKHFCVPVSVLGALHALAHLILLKLQEVRENPATDSHVVFYFPKHFPYHLLQLFPNPARQAEQILSFPFRPRLNNWTKVTQLYMVELRLELKPAYAKCHDLSTQMSEQIRPVLRPLLGPLLGALAEIRATGLPVLGVLGWGQVGETMTKDTGWFLPSRAPSLRRVEVTCQTRQRQGSIEGRWVRTQVPQAGGRGDLS